MGKNLRQQRRGRGTPTYRFPKHRLIGRVSYANVPHAGSGTVVDIVHASGRYAPLAVIDFGMSKEEARKILFGIGRVFFDRKTYQKSEAV